MLKHGEGMLKHNQNRGFETKELKLALFDFILGGTTI